MTEQASPSATWVHLLPAGTFYGRDGRGPYTLASPDAVITASRSLAGRRQLPIDYEHQTLNAEKNGKPAPAAGWITGLKSKPDGIWALVEWTDAAAAHIAKREYRYLSPVFYHTQEGVVTSVMNAALTNYPNLDQLTALARAEHKTMDELTAKLQEAAALLGLPATADQAAILKRIQDVGRIAGELATMTGDVTLAPQSANPDPTKFVPIGDFERVVADANKLRQGVTLTAATARVDQEIRSGNLPPFLRDWALSVCTVNMPVFDGFLERVGPAFHRLMEPQAAHASQRRTGTENDLSNAEDAMRRAMNLSVDEFNKGRGGADKD
jgi:phage I-like protein